MNTCNIEIEALNDPFEDNPRELQDILYGIISRLDAGEDIAFKIVDSRGDVCGRLWYSHPKWKYVKD